jgi:hypothetical protein
VARGGRRGDPPPLDPVGPRRLPRRRTRRRRRPTAKEKQEGEKEEEMEKADVEEG